MTPFKVEPVFESWETPKNYRRYPGGDRLPNTLKVWRVQQPAAATSHFSRPYGAVGRPFDASDSSTAEVLVKGYNTGKMDGAVAVGRDGNFLQWGFSAPPSKMTEAGRRLFLNAVCYISKFDGQKTSSEK